MKTSNLFLRMVYSYIIVSLVMCVTSCSSNDEPIIPEPVNPVIPENSGDVEFKVINEGGVGEGSASSPAQVFNDTLKMVISQKSSIRDTDGSVFKCEPKATIEVSSQLDTVFVTDENLLTEIEELVDIKTTQSGKSPVLNQMFQQFKVGEKFIDFKLGHEVYYYTSKNGQKIEMPFVKVNKANLGKTLSAEEKAKLSESNISLEAVEIEPIFDTRVIVTDSIPYKVKATFNVEIEEKNVKDAQKQVLDFEVNYIGVVVSTSEIPDPDVDSGNVTYETEIKGASGTGEISSSIQVENKNAMITFNQKSIFNDSGGKVFSCEPTAVITVERLMDTVFVANKNLLTEVEKPEVNTFATGENPIKNVTTQKFNLGGKQIIDFNLSDETFFYHTNAGQKMEMPCIKLNPVNLGSSSAKNNSEAIQLKECNVSRVIETDSTLYEVIVKFNIDLDILHIKEETHNTLELVVKYFAVVVTNTEYPDPESDSGKVTFNTKVEGASGNGTSSSPIFVNGNSAKMIINQTSSFTDYDGSVFTREPVATINLSTLHDTVFVDDISLLTAYNKKSNVSTKKNGENPTTYVTNQTFEVGGNYINFNLASEAYQYKMKSGNVIEMPYMKVNNATLVSSPNAKSRAEASPIVLKDITLTRASYVDTKIYNVAVTFSTTIESVNTSEKSDETVYWEVNYTGVVEKVIDEPEPDPDPESDSGEVEFNTDIEGGDGGSGIPSAPVQVSGTEPVKMVVSQKSSFRDTDGSVFTCEPKASIQLATSLDTVFVDDVSLLKAFNRNADENTSVTGKNPTVHTTSQVFTIGGNTVEFNSAFETYVHTLISGNQIEMPYTKFANTQLGNSSVNLSRSNASPIVLKEVRLSRASVTDRTVYDVTATFSTTLETVNTQNAVQKTVDFDVNYVGVVEKTTVIPDEPTVVDVSYNKGYKWIEPHHNMSLALHAYVERVKTLSNGEKLVDRFEDRGHTQINSMGIDPSFKFPGTDVVSFHGEKETIEYGSLEKQRNDSVWFMRHTTYVNDISQLTIRERDNGFNNGTFGEFSRYQESVKFDENTCWYARTVQCSKDLFIYYKKNNILSITLQPCLPDQYLKIDGKIIDFLDELPNYDWQFHVEDVNVSGLLGKRYIYEVRINYKGKNFYIGGEETILQREKK